MTFNFNYCINYYFLYGKNSIVLSYFSKKIRDFDYSNINNYHCKSSSIIKSCHNIAGILAFAFTAMAQKPSYQVIAFWPRDFEEIETKDQDHNIMNNNKLSKITPNIAAIILKSYNYYFGKI